MHVVHLTSSTFYGGPERQMLGLASHLDSAYRTSFLSFSEQGQCMPFLAEARDAGFDALELEHDTPDFRAAIREVTRYLRQTHADVLLAHGYKANLLGRMAARRADVPIIGVSRGWTSETLKVRCYDTLDKAHLRWLDRVVCVSEGQAQKVRAWGVPENRLRVIRNAARVEAFTKRDPAYRDQWQAWTHGGLGILAAGRLSPEKGFLTLARAAKQVLRNLPTAHIILCGDGPERTVIDAVIKAAGLGDRFHMVGFRDDLDRILPWADIVALPSHTEGLPNIILEASSARVPVVATAVGGTPEAVRDGVTGYLVPAGDEDTLANRLLELGRDANLRQRMGYAGRALMEGAFSFAAQAKAYEELFAEVVQSAFAGVAH